MKTFRLMIAEDELAIANLIKKLIDFERLNLDFIGIAANGQLAYEMIVEHQPDIVITDISMPAMSGLELIEKVQSETHSCHFIIISGLTYFNYALSAIKMGVEDYLLKPINKDELNNVLEKTIIKIASHLNIDYQIQKLGLDAHLQLQRLRRSFIMNLLYNKQRETDVSVSDLNQEYSYHFEPNTAFMMGITQIDGISSLNLATQNIIIEQLMRSFQTEIKKRCIDSEVYNKNNQFIFVINYHPQQEALMLGCISSIQEDLAGYLSTYEGLRATISCGTPTTAAASLPYSLKTAYEVLNARIMLDSKPVLLAKDFLYGAQKPDILPSQADLRALRSSIEIRDQLKIQSLLLHIFKTTAASCRPCPHLLLDVYRDVVSALLSDLHQHRIISVTLTDSYMRYCDAIEQFSSLKELMLFTTSFITELLPFNDEADNQENRLISTAKQFIQEHYSANLKLEDVADQVFLAPSYFGVLFKKEVGEPFSAYLTSVRIEKAKELLHDVRYNIAEIANAVGYQDKRYFSKLFKEQVGVTPKEYRKIYVS